MFLTAPLRHSAVGDASRNFGGFCLSLDDIFSLPAGRRGVPRRRQVLKLEREGVEWVTVPIRLRNRTGTEKRIFLSPATRCNERHLLPIRE